jgi:hypothetical protein
MISCPKCANGAIELSDAKGFVEKRILPLFRLAPFHCPSCGRRVYRSPLVPALPTDADYLASPAAFLKSEDGLTFQQLIEDLREAERRIENKAVARREVGG